MRHVVLGRPLSVAALALFALAGCRGSNGIAGPPALPLAGTERGQGAFQALALERKIRHVVIVVQENRSFNNLFFGYHGAKTQSYGYDSNNKKIFLQPTSLATKWDMQHNGQGYIISCNGTGKKIQGTDCRMNGFNKELCHPVKGPCPKRPDLAYAYVPHAETKPYFDMAHQYVLADQMYASDFDISSFESHQYIIAGVNPNSSVDYPDGDWGCTGGPTDQIPILFKYRKWLNEQQRPIKTERPCWNPNTLGDELDDAKLPWAFYAVPVAGGGSFGCGGDEMRPDGASGRGPGIWSAYQAIKHICYGPDWAQDVAPFSPPSKFLTDIKNGELRAVTWITPTDKNSDHGGSNSAQGPSWVASVVNAIGESKFWDSTAIFIFWDDPGGWYDPEPPGYMNKDGLGYRLPLLIISPYAKKGYVDHTHYEHGSILKFVEDRFGLPRLEPPDELASDRRANSTIGAFDFMQAPRKFVKIKAPLGEDYFIHEPLDTRPPDTE
jgi:phospholipase C